MSTKKLYVNDDVSKIHIKKHSERLPIRFKKVQKKTLHTIMIWSQEDEGSYMSITQDLNRKKTENQI